MISLLQQDQNVSVHCNWSVLAQVMPNFDGNHPYSLLLPTSPEDYEQTALPFILCFTLPSSPWFSLGFLYSNAILRLAIVHNSSHIMFQQDLSSIVVDLGSISVKAGYSGEDSPKFVAPSFVGNAGDQMVDQSKPTKCYVGDSNLNLRKEGMDIHNVYAHGRVKSFDDYEKLMHGMLQQEMRIDPSSFSLLLSEDNIHDRNEREKIAAFVFETLNMKNMFFCKTAVLSCFSTGRSTAVIVDCGADMSSAITVHDGFALSKSIKRVPFGGQLLTKEVEKYIETQLNVPVVPRAALNPLGLTPSYIQYHKDALLRDIKETLFRIDQGSSESDLVEYQLPHKNIVKLDRTRVSNVFLNPPSSDPNFKGLHHMVHDNINQCDVDIKKQLYGNMIITGGNSLISGLTNKLQTKVGELAPANVKLKLITFPFPIERRFAPWIGGSILSSLSSFQSFWVGEHQWREHGSVIFDKKCA